MACTSNRLLRDRTKARDVVGGAVNAVQAGADQDEAVLRARLRVGIGAAGIAEVGASFVGVEISLARRRVLQHRAVKSRLNETQAMWEIAGAGRLLGRRSVFVHVDLLTFADKPA